MTQKEYKEYNGDKRRMQMARMVADMVFSEFEIRLDEERERMAKVIADTVAHQVELKMNQQSMRHNCVVVEHGKKLGMWTGVTFLGAILTSFAGGLLYALWMGFKAMIRMGGE